MLCVSGIAGERTQMGAGREASNSQRSRNRDGNGPGLRSKAVYSLGAPAIPLVHLLGWRGLAPKALLRERGARRSSRAQLTVLASL